MQTQLSPSGHDHGSEGSHQPGIHGTHSQPAAEHSQYDPSGQEYGIDGSQPGMPAVHRQPSAVHSHHSPAGHEYGSPIVQSSTVWHEQTSPSQKQAWPAGQAAASNGSQPVTATQLQDPYAVHSQYVPAGQLVGSPGVQEGVVGSQVHSPHGVQMQVVPAGQAYGSSGEHQVDTGLQ